MIKLSLVVGIGGFIGANLRYWTSYLLAQRLGDVFPWGTLVVNVVGCLLLGFLTVFGTQTITLSPTARLFLGTGILGALTTFSTFTVETLNLVEGSSYGMAGANLLANLVTGLLAAWVGMTLARALSA